ncbi:MAG: tail fiber domain-containing protein [Balneolales bacterium]|nr:tail fiber domain-containing protein [Balneolales bacterium]
MNIKFTSTVLSLLLVFAFVVDGHAQTNSQHHIIETESPVSIQSNRITTSRSTVTNAGQVPQGFNFQAIARNANGDLLSNQNIQAEITVIQGSESGNVVYTETHAITTNQVGLFQIVIGEGETSDNFTTIEWANDNYFVGIAVDTDGSGTFEDLGATRLLSVPYALVARNVIDGVSVGETPITQYNINTAQGDTSFIINSSGPTGLATLRVNSATDALNTGISGNAISNSDNSSEQRGVQGIASGSGTGTHIGILGSTVNASATVGARRGVQGQASSGSRFNYGVYGIAQGAGDGTIVPIGEEGAEGAGSFNIAGGFYSSGNANGNLGVEGVVSGSAGARINIGVEGRVTATANAPNFGVNGRAFNSPVENIGITGDASGPEGSRNIGVRGNAYGDGDNYAGWFNGRVQVNGDLTYTGSLNNTSDLYLKEDIRPLENALAAVMQLRPATYHFRGNGEYKGMRLSTGQHYGLIAQEVEEVFPSIVQNNLHTYSEVVADAEAGPDSGSETVVEKQLEYKTMNYTELIPVLIKAIQEQQQEIEKLREEVRNLHLRE